MSFSKIAGHKIEIQKSIVSLYHNNDQYKDGIKKILLICYSIKKNKHLGINLTKEG